MLGNVCYKKRWNFAFYIENLLYFFCFRCLNALSGVASVWMPVWFWWWIVRNHIQLQSKREIEASTNDNFTICGYIRFNFEVHFRCDIQNTLTYIHIFLSKFFTIHLYNKHTIPTKLFFSIFILFLLELWSISQWTLLRISLAHIIRLTIVVKFIII